MFAIYINLSPFIIPKLTNHISFEQKPGFGSLMNVSLIFRKIEPYKLSLYAYQSLFIFIYGVTLKLIALAVGWRVW